MTHINLIPGVINERLIHFQNEVNKNFSFLNDFGYALDKIENGRAENFLNYFSNFFFRNGETKISVDFSTDNINGIRTAFPNLKEEELPVFDNNVSCSIHDTNAFMSIDNFIETQFPEISTDNFTIKVTAVNIKNEITRIIENYSDFFRTYLTDVLQKNKIYDCYTDRFYDKVFKEIHYR